jgi:hypothetical protein
MPSRIVTSASFLLLLIGGCDGVYQYEYRGQLVSPDQKPIAAETMVHLTPLAGMKLPVFEAMPGVTDTQGRFQGTLCMSTGWVFMVRPPAPEIKQLDLTLDAPPRMTIPLELEARNQPVMSAGNRKIDLGVIVVPVQETQSRKKFGKEDNSQ